MGIPDAAAFSFYHCRTLPAKTKILIIHPPMLQNKRRRPRREKPNSPAAPQPTETNVGRFFIKFPPLGRRRHQTTRLHRLRQGFEVAAPVVVIQFSVACPTLDIEILSFLRECYKARIWSSMKHITRGRLGQRIQLLFSVCCVSLLGHAYQGVAQNIGHYIRHHHRSWA